MVKTTPAKIIQVVRNVRLGGDFVTGGCVIGLTCAFRDFGFLTLGILLNQLSTD